MTPRSEVLSERVVAAIADAADTSERALDPLYEVIDPEALDRLFAPTYEGETCSSGRVQFVYAGYEVVVHSTEAVSVSAVDASGEDQQG